MVGDDTGSPEPRPNGSDPTPPANPPADNVRDLASERARARAKAQSERPLSVRLAKARGVLPRHCPYEPVGHNGDFYYLIDAQHNLRSIKPDSIRRNMLASICDGSKWLEENYPRSRKGGGVNGIAVDKASDDLMRACHLMGQWSPDDSVRGRGAWRGEDNDLILHRGNHLLIDGTAQPTGRHGEYVYIQRPAMVPLAPAHQREGTHSAGNELLARLDTFAWQRGTLDSLLMLGWIGAAMVGGALDFRPHVFITGETQAGKSTLQLLLQCAFGHLGMISVADTSAAGVWQAFGCDTLPVGLDELEPEGDPRKAADTLKLARLGSSGGKILRGSAMHAAESFIVRSCFCCAAILVPPMPSQDANRFCVLELLQNPPGVQTLPFSTDRLADLGGALQRRMAEHFKRMMVDVLPAIRSRMIGEYGFSTRAADLYGALFAASDVALYDQFQIARLDRWCSHRFMLEVKAEIEAEQTSEQQRCFFHLLSQRIDYRRPESQPIGELVSHVVAALRRGRRQPALFGTSDDEAAFAGEDDNRARDAHHRLLNIGVRIAALPVSRDSNDGSDRALYAVIANQHAGLAGCFHGTVWATTSNAAGGGGWTRALRRKPGAYAVRQAVRFRDGVRARAWAVPIDDLFPADGVAPTPDRPQEDDLRPADRRFN